MSSREKQEMDKASHDAQFDPDPLPTTEDDPFEYELSDKRPDYESLELWQEHLEALEKDPRLKVMSGLNTGLGKVTK